MKCPDCGAEFWTTSEVAEYLGVRLGTVSSYRVRGQMPQPDVQFGRTWCWRAETIRSWRARGEVVDAQTC